MNGTLLFIDDATGVITMTENDCVVYGWWDIRTPSVMRYIGKGAETRLNDHMREAKSNHRCHKCNFIRKVWREGGRIGAAYLFSDLTEQEANEKEIELITFYGRKDLGKGPLLNKTDGGDGSRGWIPSAQFSAKMSVAVKLRFEDPVAHAKSAAAMKLRWEDPIEREKMLLAQKLRYEKEDPAVREKFKIAQKLRFEDPTLREKLRDVQNLRYEDIEAHNKLSDAQKLRFEDLAEREKLSIAQKLRFEDDAERKKLSDAQNLRFEDPISREKLREGQKRRYANPTALLERSIAAKMGWERRRARLAAASMTTDTSLQKL